MKLTPDQQQDLKDLNLILVQAKRISHLPEDQQGEFVRLFKPILMIRLPWILKPAANWIASFVWAVMQAFLEWNFGVHWEKRLTQGKS